MFIKSNENVFACVLVGLPARGKTFIAQKICRYLQWLGVPNKAFNVGNYRRKLTGPHTHEFFDPSNEEATEMRKKAAMEALSDMITWLTCTNTNFKDSDIVRVAIYDATNSTIERRKMIQDGCQSRNIQTIFIESICDDVDIIMQNIMDVKLKSPDYANVDAEFAKEDFISRIKHYEQTYEPINETLSESYLSFVKLVNVGAQVIINRVHGYLQSRVVYYLMNLNIHQKTIYICRHGESQYNVLGKIGGDSNLSPNGLEFARRLPSVLLEQMTAEEKEKCVVWTSTLKRTIETSQFLPFPKLQWKALDEIDAGVCDGLTYAQIQEMYPKDFEDRDKDKFHYRYPGGESYADLTLRLDPILHTLEKTPSCLIIAHQAVHRAIYAYFHSMSQEDLPYVHIPLHAVMALRIRAYGCDVKIIKAVDTHRDGRVSTEDGKHIKRGSYGDRGALNVAKMTMSPTDDDKVVDGNDGK